uniref:Zinc finger protein 7-like n=1 Tax=Populus alba TaxID=43335 RepID=A0A4U5P683_POPAL|nr:zinc finger protein 7-like [Populus alba]
MGNIDITDYGPGMPPITSRGGMGSNTKLTGPSVNQNDKTFSDGYARDTEEVNSNERLTLGLGRNSCIMDIEQGSQSKFTASKVFSSNVCRRKFYSSRALGGRQNAHKRERGAIERYRWERHMAMIEMNRKTYP